MPLYEVQSGGIMGYFKAPGVEEAFIKAIRRSQKVEGKEPPMPGLILRVREVSEAYKPVPTKDDPEGWIYLNPLDIIKKYG